MSRLLSFAAVVAIVSSPAVFAQKKTQPIGPAPKYSLAWVEGGLLRYTVGVTAYRVERIVRVVKKDGRELKVPDTVYVPILKRGRKLADLVVRRKLADLVITNAAGEKRDAKDVQALLRRPKIVLISSNGDGVDPFHLKGVKPDTLVIVDKKLKPRHVKRPSVLRLEGIDARVVPKEDITLSWVEASGGMTVAIKTKSGVRVEARKMYIGDGAIAVPLEANNSGIWLQRKRRFYQADKLPNGLLIKVRRGYRWISQLNHGDLYVILRGVTFVEPGMLEAKWSGTDNAGRRISMSFGANKAVTFSIGKDVTRGTYAVLWFKSGICHLNLDLGRRGKLTTIMQPNRERLRVELNKPGEKRPAKFTGKAVVLSRKVSRAK